jgi:hypothetical protein
MKGKEHDYFEFAHTAETITLSKLQDNYGINSDLEC